MESWKIMKIWDSVQAKNKYCVGIFKKIFSPFATPSCFPYGFLHLFSSTVSYFKTVFLLYSNTCSDRQFNCHHTFFLVVQDLLLWWNNFRHTEHKSIKYFPYFANELLWVVEINFIPPMILTYLFNFYSWKWRLQIIKLKWESPLKALSSLFHLCQDVAEEKSVQIFHKIKMAQQIQSRGWCCKCFYRMDMLRNWKAPVLMDWKRIF